ncbi:MAG: cytochrome c3 family protein [Elusimicrobia bacterium]|nr:cytochrome c3 family protein [Elusimicrobiota bacterium]
MKTFLLPLLLLFPQTALAASVLNSKHDLSADSGTSGPRAVSEQDTCVFCHSVHQPSRVESLWGRKDSAEAFTFYSSNYLNNYLGMAAPTMADLQGSRSKLCLSCHDGVTALGSVYNLAQPIAVQGSLTAASVIGTDLSNDHPVLYDVKPGAGPPTQPGTNPEIVLPPAGDRVKVYGDSKRVECTSCHDPHDDQNGKFLVKSNAGAALCLTCHQKAGWSASAHATSNRAYTPPGGAATTVAEYSCRSCHKAHGASSAQAYILNGAEEATCYGCHGNPPLTGAKNIKSSLSKAYKHPTEAKTGVHKNPEADASNLGNATRHGECWDCHNPHQAKAGTHAAGSNAIGQVLLGQWGVEPSYGTTPFTQPSSYARQTFTNTTSFKEYQLCFKCHSSYAFGVTPPTGLTDQAVEFNKNNASYHNLGVAGALSKARTAPPKTTSYVSPWGYQSVMACADCHASDSDADPRGAHGSTNARILRGQWTSNTGRSGYVTGHLCFKCHQANVYGAGAAESNTDATAFSGSSGSKNLHAVHASKSYACMDCHAKVPHGLNRARLIVYRSDPAAYRGGVATRGINSWTANPRSYQESNCTTSSCH